MDFLVLVGTYLVVFVGCVLLYLYGDTSPFVNGPIGLLRRLLSKVVKSLIPQTLIDIVYDTVYNVLHTRNQVLQFIFGALVLLGHAVWVFDMLPILYLTDPEANHTLLPLAVVFTNLYFFHRSCVSDPGEITPAKLDKYSQVYKYDGHLYVPNRVCSTCNQTKPARSKHCGICNRCVHRFDHHCIWTNNDVGGLNHRYFLLFLLTLIGMAVQGVVVGGKCLWLYTLKNRLLEARVLLDNGDTVPISVFIIIQNLFMQYPRLVFLVLGVFVLIPLIASFAVYHTYLILTNQTTNERYKSPAVEHSKNNIDTSRTKKGVSLQQSNHRRKAPDICDKARATWRPYNRGYIYNFCEVFFLDNLNISKNTKRRL